ncbi:hypothetical protein PENSTE_c011G00470 [Penicillium steckii]|uniref:Major facilitator superfamily (MFS) profile domain-containing protein n=1 Tax=Penicillium steckii TaxID=303698 RepID=A0A1V6T6M6_9EURO|nr:hypothetical protein PENSTE_c011G00470 [Penicillium steckii]
MSDLRDSVDITTESIIQSRLVMAPQDVNPSYDTDAQVPFSSTKTDQSDSLSPKGQDLEAPFANHAVPTSEEDHGRVATAEEVRDLVHVVDKIPTRVWIACIAGVLERFAWYGVTAPLQNYLQNEPGGAVPGMLGLRQAAASNIVNALIIGSYITPVPAAVIADSWLGRYKMMIYSAIAEAIGATILFTTSLQAVANETATLAGVIAACVLLAIGSGAFKTTVVPFIADQYDETEYRIKITKDGGRVITSRELTITYIYNFFYWCVNIVGFLADCTPLLELYVGFWLAYLIPCCVMVVSLAPIVLCRGIFVRATPNSNVLPQAYTALKFAVINGFKMDASRPETQLRRYGRQVPWEESLLFPIHWLCYNQTFNNLISQAGQMVTYGIPNDMMKIAGAISGIFVAPLIQKGLYPYLSKRGRSFGPIARMTVGFVVLTLSMAYTTVVQKLIYQTGPCYHTPLECAGSEDHTVPNQISVFL